MPSVSAFTPKTDIIICQLSRFLRLVDMFPQLLLLHFQRSLLLTPHSATAHDHHEGFVPRLLPVGRTAGCLLVLLALGRPKLVSSFSSFLDRSHTFSIISFRFLPRSQDIVLGNEGALFESRFVSLERCKLPFGGRSATTFDCF